MEEIKNILDNLQTLEGKVHFIRRLPKNYKEKSLPYIKELVKELAKRRAKNHSNSDTHYEAGRIFEELDLLDEAYKEYKAYGEPYILANIAKKLGKFNEAKNYASNYIMREINRRKEGERKGYIFGERNYEFYAKLAREAEEMDLKEMATTLWNNVAEEAGKIGPEFALRLVEDRPITDNVRKKLYEEATKKAEERGDFLRAAELCRKAGLADRAQLYEKILNF